MTSAASLASAPLRSVLGTDTTRSNKVIELLHCCDSTECTTYSHRRNTAVVHSDTVAVHSIELVL